MYCQSLIPASTFAYWSDKRRLMSASCPECGRRVIVAAATVRRLLEGTTA
jgi:hypothetical protein